MLGANSAQGYLKGFEVENTNGFLSLKSLSLGDGRRFNASDLIGIEVTHYYNTADTSGILYPASLVTAPPPGTRAALLEDLYLNTGLRDIGTGNGVSALTPLSRTPGIAFTFLTPVVNGPGDDVVIFEMGGANGNLHVDRLDGLGSPLTLRSNLQNNPFLGSVYFGYYQRNFLPSLEDMESASLNFTGPHSDRRADGVALDLSSLGYAPGEVVTGLFLQTTPSGHFGAADPVLIVGLPQVPECNACALLLLGSFVLLVRARHRREKRSCLIPA